MVGASLDNRAAPRDTEVVAATTPRVARAPRPISVIVPLSVWCGLIVAARFIFLRLQASGAGFRLDAGPLHGTIDSRFTPRLLLPLAVAAVLIGVGPRLARTMEWRKLVIVGALASAAWAVSLALVDGVAGVTGPIEAGTDYLGAAQRITDPAAYLSSFVDELAHAPVHVQGHPPGLVLLLHGLDRFGLGGAGIAAAVFIGGGAVAVAAVGTTVRNLAGETTARAALPFLVLSPAAIWIATSADALFAGVGACAVALIVTATGRRDTQGDACALAGGLLVGIAAFLSYGLVLIAVVPAVVAWYRRRARPLLLATLGALPVFVAFSIAGFSWVSGLVATRGRYFAGVASRRPYAEFLVLNAAALAIALGPALAVALTRLRAGSLRVLVAGALAAVAVAMLSGMSKGEVERIWLPFMVFLLPAGAALGTRRDTGTRGWLALQAGTALLVTTVVKTAW